VIVQYGAIGELSLEQHGPPKMRCSGGQVKLRVAADGHNDRRNAQAEQALLGSGETSGSPAAEGQTARAVNAEQRLAHGAQQSLPLWMGGHLMVPKLQKTQQSPGFGLSIVPQPAHSKKNTHALIGISSSLAAPQCGQVTTERVMVICLISLRPNG
jgi:hypothetical protein